MKKNLFIGAGICSMMLLGCSENLTNDENPSLVDTHTIHFNSSTTRATISTLSTLQGSTTGFVVYGTSGATPAAWYTNGTGSIDGTNNYKYSGTAWGWATNPVAWPTTLAGYPMNFYAYYPASATGVTITPTVASALSGAITIQPTYSSYTTLSATPPTETATAANQVDLLSAKSTTVSKPTDGYLPLNFNHILSKINFGIIAGNQNSVYVQSVRIANLAKTNTYNYFTQAWGAAPSGTAFYGYFDNYNSASTPQKSVFTPTTADEVTANPIYNFATSPNVHLMLMPQTTSSWVPASWTGPSYPTQTYIEVVYRIATSADPNSVGYTQASSHPNYSTLGNSLTGPLFIKVGFPLSTTWLPGQSYTYNICLGTTNSTGGYYLEGNYIDQNGNLTQLPIGKTPGTPVANGNINFKVTVSPWGAENNTSIYN